MTKQLTTTHQLAVKAIVNYIYFIFTENSNLNVSQCQRWNSVCIQLIDRIPFFSVWNAVEMEHFWKILFAYVFVSGTEDAISSKFKLHILVHRKEKYSAFPCTLWVKILVCYKSRVSGLNDLMGEQVLVCKCHGALMIKGKIWLECKHKCSQILCVWFTSSYLVMDINMILPDVVCSKGPCGETKFWHTSLFLKSNHTKG